MTQQVAPTTQFSTLLEEFQSEIPDSDEVLLRRMQSLDQNFEGVREAGGVHCHFLSSAAADLPQEAHQTRSWLQGRLRVLRDIRQLAYNLDLPAERFTVIEVLATAYRKYHNTPPAVGFLEAYYQRTRNGVLPFFARRVLELKRDVA